MLNFLKQKRAIRIALLAILLTIASWMLSVNMLFSHAATEHPKNPRITEDGNITWDCVYFGNYYQSEVKNSEKVYNTLRNATDWDDDEIVVDGAKYRRVTRWENDNDPTSTAPTIKVQHYFKYEPIKWRVLCVDENEAFLLADKNLETKGYHDDSIGVTWAVSTIRSWLNGYGSDVNKSGKDYTTNNFMEQCFTKAERLAIHQKNVKNSSTSKFGTNGGNDTQDKIFLMSIDEIETPAYGLSVSTISENMEANTEYMSIFNDNNTNWWLRSPGHNFEWATCVDDNSVDHSNIDDRNISSRHIGFQIAAVRPALRLNLDSDVWTDAGTVNRKFRALKEISAQKRSTKYRTGATLSDNGIYVTASYSDGSRRTNQKPSQTNASQIDMSTPGTKNLIVTYEQTNPMHIVKTATIPITVTQAKSSKSKAATVTKPAKVTIKKVISPKKKTLKVTWKRDSKATGYQAMIATDKKFKKNKKTATISKNKTVSKTFTKLKSRKTYYAKVRAYKKSGSKKVYGAYSKVKKVRVK